MNNNFFIKKYFIILQNIKLSTNNKNIDAIKNVGVADILMLPASKKNIWHKKTLIAMS